MELEGEIRFVPKAAISPHAYPSRRGAGRRCAGAMNAAQAKRRAALAAGARPFRVSRLHLARDRTSNIEPPTSNVERGRGVSFAPRENANPPARGAKATMSLALIAARRTASQRPTRDRRVRSEARQGLRFSRVGDPDGRTTTRVRVGVWRPLLRLFPSFPSSCFPQVPRTARASAGLVHAEQRLTSQNTPVKDTRLRRACPCGATIDQPNRAFVKTRINPTNWERPRIKISIRGRFSFVGKDR